MSKHQQLGVISIAEMEKHAIYDALEKMGGDKIKAARMLGIGKTTLYRKLKEYGHNKKR
jgi:two-component system response regulator HydG